MRTWSLESREAGGALARRLGGRDVKETTRKTRSPKAPSELVEIFIRSFAFFFSRFGFVHTFAARRAFSLVLPPRRRCCLLHEALIRSRAHA